MRPPWEWTEADLELHVADGIEESINLDYKAAKSLIGKSDSQRREISKDVSAFANSAGGTIIYGIAEDPTIRGSLRILKALIRLT